MCSLYKRQDCRATDFKHQIKMQIMLKESVGMPSVIFTVLQIVLTLKLSLLFSCGSRAQNKRANFLNHN